jgi:hypothetical protein
MADDAPFSVVLHYDPQMVAELALGADHPHEIAARYGVDTVDYEHLSTQPWFERLVAEKRHEYHDTGVLFTAKAAMMAESLFTRLFQQSMAGSLTQPLMVETAKQLADIGRLKPQPLNTQPLPGATPAFQINIQVNGSDVLASTTPAMVAVPADPPSAAEAVMRLEFGDTVPTPDPAAAADTQLDALGPAPVGIRVRDFDLRPSALVGDPMAVQAAMGSTVSAPNTVGLPKDASLR